MKKKVKQEKGITLVALIITIIVLLILAIITIAAVSGDGIINHAENARDSYKTAQNTENKQLTNYVSFLDTQASKSSGSSSNNNSSTVTFTMDQYGEFTVPSGTTWSQFVAEQGFPASTGGPGWLTINGSQVSILGSQVYPDDEIQNGTHYNLDG